LCVGWLDADVPGSVRPAAEGKKGMLQTVGARLFTAEGLAQKSEIISCGPREPRENGMSDPKRIPLTSLSHKGG